MHLYKIEIIKSTVDYAQGIHYIVAQSPGDAIEILENSFDGHIKELRYEYLDEPFITEKVIKSFTES